MTDPMKEPGDATLTSAGADVTREVAPPAGAPLGLQLPRGTELGRYVVLDPLGQGGMGVVFTAYDPRLHRRIAIKLLHPGGQRARASGGQDAQARLVREAQALAQLSHPNIVSVFDVGTYQDQVFMAMELVEGESLRARLKRSRPHWRETLRIFRQAGEGLNAAHGAGLVHRDFKPDNVLLANSGRVFVMDFGLARAEAHGAGEREVTEELLEAAASPTLQQQENYLGVPLSRTDVISGTLPYMSPEQLGGAPADARGDQFAFCVALYEALYGERPFKTEKGPDRWTVPPKPADVAVPAWLRQIVLRGLNPKPEDRFPSMAAVLAELAKDPAAKWRRAGWVAAALTVAAAVGVSVASVKGRPAPCQDVAAPLQPVWDAPQRAALKASFLATGSPTAGALWETTERTLGAYAAAWSQTRGEACEATRVRGVQSDEVLSLRMMCLDRRLQELSAMIGELRSLDRATLVNAPRAASQLVPIASCSNVEELKAPIPLPADPAQRAKILDAQKELAHGRALLAAGKVKPGLELSAALAQRGRALGYPPFEAEALELSALLQDKAGRVKDAAGTAEQAIWAAVAAGDKRILVTTASLKVREHALLNEFDLSQSWADRARLMLSSVGDSPGEEGALENQLGVVRAIQGKLDEAIPHLNRAKELWTRAYGADAAPLASVLSNLAGAHHRRGDRAQAIQLTREALQLDERWLGKDHPQTFVRVHNLALLYLEAGEINAAEPLVQRAYEGRKQVLGEDNPMTGISYALLAWLDGFHGDYARGLERIERSHALALAATGRPSPETLQQQGTRAELLGRSGRLEEALALQKELLAQVEKLSGDEDEDVATGLGRLVRFGLASGRRADAAAALERLRKLAARPGMVPLFSQELLEAQGLFELADHRPAEALRSFEALRKQVDGAPADSASRVPALLGMGRAQAALGKQAEARELLTEGLRLGELSRMAPDVLAPAKLALEKLEPVTPSVGTSVP